LAALVLDRKKLAAFSAAAVRTFHGGASV